VTIKRMLAAAGISGLAAVGAVLAAAGGPGQFGTPAWAAPGDRAQPVQLRQATSTEPRPRAGEWWLTTWKMQPVVWPLTEGAGVTVAVVDTGVQADVPDLSGVVLPGGDATGQHANGQHANGETDLDTDGDGHGTMMAVLIAGQGRGTGMIGMAPQAKILPVVVTTGSSAATSDPGAIAAGITYAANHGARVIDVSQELVSGAAPGCDPAVQAAVAYALARDAVVVAAAGDTSLIGTRPAEPASCVGVVAVGAVEPNRVLWPGNTHQPYLTVVNPGADLITSGRGGRLVTGVSGTRAASALAAGAIALIRSRYPDMPWYQVVQRVTATALTEGGHVPPVKRAVPNDSYGYGIFRLSHAIDATAYPVPASAPNPVYAKYRAWLASPQGQAISRQLEGSGSRPAGAASATAGGGSAGPVLIAIAVPLAAAGLGVAAFAARTRLGKNPGKRVPGKRGPGKRGLGGPRRRQSGAVFPDRGRNQGGYLPYPDLQDGDPPAEYPPLGEDAPYRIPPYSPAPDLGRSPFSGTSLLGTNYNDRLS
jgi:hypothetical protein